MKTKKDYIMVGDTQAIESALPKDAKIIAKCPIAYGEKSGHIHVITGDYEMYEDKIGDKYVWVGSKGAISQHIHESIWKHANYDTIEQLQKADHKPARLLPNKVYRIGIHKAYNPYKKIQEKVID